MCKREKNYTGRQKGAQILDGTRIGRVPWSRSGGHDSVHQCLSSARVPTTRRWHFLAPALKQLHLTRSNMCSFPAWGSESPLWDTPGSHRPCWGTFEASFWDDRSNSIQAAGSLSHHVEDNCPGEPLRPAGWCLEPLRFWGCCDGITWLLVNVLSELPFLHLGNGFKTTLLEEAFVYSSVARVPGLIESSRV